MSVPSRVLRLDTIRNLVAHGNLRRAPALPTANAMSVYVGPPTREGYKRTDMQQDETIKKKLLWT